MDLMWFILGGLTVGAVWGLFIWNSKKGFTKLQVSGFILSILIAVFAAAWSISSIAERESQAAAMGIMIFGGTAIILFLLSLKLEQIKAMFSKNKGAQVTNNKGSHL